MDPTLQPVIDKLINSQDPTNATHQYTKSKYLYLGSYQNPLGAALRLYEDKDGQGPGERSTLRDRIVVPATLVKQVLERCHDHRAQPGVTATGANVNLRYWWPSHGEDVASYVKSCQFCRSQKVHYRYKGTWHLGRCARRSNGTATEDYPRT
jgi:Integrase zinc binding domain